MFLQKQRFCLRSIPYLSVWVGAILLFIAFIFANTVNSKDEFFTVALQLLALIGVSFIVGEIFDRIKLPRLVGEILGGVALSLFGVFFVEIYSGLFPVNPAVENLLAKVVQVGVWFLIFETGLHMDVEVAKKMFRPAIAIGGIGVVVPILLGWIMLKLFTIFYPLGQTTNPSITLWILAILMAVSATVIIMRVLRDWNLIQSEFGLMVICGYVVNDVLAFVAFSIVTAIADKGQVNWSYLSILICSTIVGVVFSFTIGRDLMTWLMRRINRGSERLVNTKILVLGVAVACALATKYADLTELLGLLLAGIMFSGISNNVKLSLTGTLVGRLVPIYFCWVGLQLKLEGNFDLVWILFFLITSICVKYCGAWLGVTQTSLSKEMCHPMGISYTPSGVIEIAMAREVLAVGLITNVHFVSIVFTAIISSLLVGPWLVCAIKSIDVVAFSKSISEAFVFCDLRNNSRRFYKKEVIERLCIESVRKGLLSNQDYQKALELINQRESLCSSVVCETVTHSDSAIKKTEISFALPHARIDKVEKTFVIFTRARSGVCWDGIKEVQLIFLIIGPQNDHAAILKIYQTICDVLRKEGMYQELIKAESGEKVVALLHKAFP